MSHDEQKYPAMSNSQDAPCKPAQPENLDTPEKPIQATISRRRMLIGLAGTLAGCEAAQMTGRLNAAIAAPVDHERDDREKRGKVKRAFLNLASDVLIFTDEARVAGGIIGDPEELTATAVTSGMVGLFESTYLASGQRKTLSFRSLAERSEGLIGGGGPTEAAAGLEQFAETTTGFNVGQSPQRLGPIQTEVLVKFPQRYETRHKNLANL
jgi:hypothetical protein